MRGIFIRDSSSAEIVSTPSNESQFRYNLQNTFNFLN